MARVPKRLHGPAHVAAMATKYTTPAQTRTIVRQIHGYNPSKRRHVLLTITIGQDGASKRIYDAYPVQPDGELDRFCYYVLEAGEVIQAGAEPPGVLTLTIGGDEEAV